MKDVCYDFVKDLTLMVAIYKIILLLVTDPMSLSQLFLCMLGRMKEANCCPECPMSTAVTVPIDQYVLPLGRVKCQHRHIIDHTRTGNHNNYIEIS